MFDQTTLFSASTVHLEHITTALNCLTPFGMKDDVLIIIDKDGLSFARENNRVISIQLYLSKELFISYNYNPPNEDADFHTKLCVKINHILDGISIVSRDKDDVVECTLSYNGEGTPFVLIFEDSVITEKVEYSTYLVRDWDPTGLELEMDAITLECIMKGDVLYSALQDMKEVGCKECYLYARAAADGKHVFALISKGQLGLSKILLPSERSILEKLEVYHPLSHERLYDSPVIGFFDFATFDKMRSSAKIASKVLLRKDIHGLMSVNILSQTDDIIVSDAKKPRAVKNTSLPLSKDYPGIVIDISVLEKIRMDEVDISEIRFLMESGDKSLAPAYNPVDVPEQRKMATGAVALQQDESLLFDKRSASEGPAKGADEEYLPATNDIPLFF
ncbi:LANO_0C00738g1_1 [Lachancea nothofagi CBS 11611]|uniref:DNA damage checkpoint control protein RAD17 n=1 Tax=Lachancea nothofagi CBS 11611 TaxID=1266666 RepID=A0A1G4J3A8_9SACH|nr:LANO_0C00738g1_1 [Lachancea nothofagi CBS 11611]